MIKILHLIDASNQAFRGSFSNAKYTYGTQFNGATYDSVSVPSGAVNTLLNYVTAMESKYFRNPDVINQYVYCFDSRTPTHKKLLHPEYKSGRTYDPKKAVHSQIMYAEEILKFYNYPVIRVEGYEADDVAYTIWKTAHYDYDGIFLHSSDKDWSFMINKDTLQVANRKNQQTGSYEMMLISKDNYSDILNIPYNTSILQKLLTSDKSDAIKGIGQKYLPMLQQANNDEVSNEELGDVRKLRDICLKAANMFPEFPIEQAMSILDVATPEYLGEVSFAPYLADYNPKSIPYNYLERMKPQTRQDIHKDMFYDFVEWTRTVR